MPSQRSPGTDHMALPGGAPLSSRKRSRSSQLYQMRPPSQSSEVLGRRTVADKEDAARGGWQLGEQARQKDARRLALRMVPVHPEARLPVRVLAPCEALPALSVQALAEPWDALRIPRGGEIRIVQRHER